MMEFLGLYHYLVFPLLLMSGIYAVIASATCSRSSSVSR